MTREESDELVFQHKLLRSYRAEVTANNTASARAAASSAQPSNTTSSEDKGKGKGKAAAVTSDQQTSSTKPSNGGSSSKSPGKAPALTSDQQGESSSQTSKRKKKSNSKPRCLKCRTWHTRECWLKHPCKKCSEWHSSSNACKFTEELEQV
jgi:hypothetical protein